MFALYPTQFIYVFTVGGSEGMNGAENNIIQTTYTDAHDSDKNCSMHNAQNINNFSTIENFLPKPQLDAQHRVDTTEKPSGMNSTENQSQNMNVDLKHLDESFSMNNGLNVNNLSTEESFSQKTQLHVQHRVDTTEKQYVFHAHQGILTQKPHLDELRVHTREKPYICQVCQKPFALRSSLIRHMRQHTREKPFVCIICHKRFSSKFYLDEHHKKHFGKKHSKESVSQKSVLDVHFKVEATEELHGMNGVENNINQNMNIDLKDSDKSCSLHNVQNISNFNGKESSFQKSDLDVHHEVEATEELHGRNDVENNINQNMNIDLEDSDKSSSMHKGQNTNHFSRKESCSQKIKLDVYHGDDTVKKQHDSNLYPEVSSPKPHLGEHPTEKPYICHLCQQPYAFKSSLGRHMRKHTREKTFVCSICQERFSFKFHLSEHLKEHAGKKLVWCKACQQPFSTKYNLKVHLKSHAVGKLHICSTCQKSFAKQSSLVQHLRVHTGEKPFECDVCHRTFSQKGNLFTHSKMHIGEKPYACTLCDARYRAKEHLKRHLRSHTGEKPFVCDICQKSFAWGADLTRHSRVHTGEKPYVCGVCERAFSQTGHLHAHFKSHAVKPK